MKKSELRLKVTRSLRRQGFSVSKRGIKLPSEADKDRLRRIHSTVVRHRIRASREALSQKERTLLGYIASGTEVKPEFVAPRLIEVKPNTLDELLFRYASLHWSIPVSSGYGRRLRFLVKDKQNDKLIGLFGLGDPVFSLSNRDQFIGWDLADRKRRMSHVMDAFVLGAVPPYSNLLCGKLVSMLAASNEVREAFRRKYRGKRSLIKSRSFDGRLALITTTSALGRSSVYNRLRYIDRHLFQSVGFTQGSGDFHFSNGLYETISNHVTRHCEPTAKKEKWGTGFRNRREIIRKFLSNVGLPQQLLYHGIQREIFVVPLARNTYEFLRGEHSNLRWYNQPAQQLFEFFRERWLIPRATRDKSYQAWQRQSWALWAKM
jgi:hypothetical protein